MSSSEPLKLILCIPIYNDWKSALQLINQIDIAFSSRNELIEVLFVDDGSSISSPDLLECSSTKISRVDILKLRRNLGHQRAIAVGLSYIHNHRKFDAVVVMDGDGEDPPTGIIQLIDSYLKDPQNSVVFAQRRRRMESFIFQMFYLMYRAIHYCLVGHSIRIGNFSILPREQLDRLVYVSELWNHYAASIVQSRIPYILVPIDRASRISGESKMNFTALVTHGLSAIAVFANTVTVRLIIATSSFAVATLLGLSSIIFIRITTNIIIPGQASYLAGIFMLAFFQIFVILLVLVIINLQSRSSVSFLPARDFTHFILKIVSLDIK